jgi:hypothetical protein
MPGPPRSGKAGASATPARIERWRPWPSWWSGRRSSSGRAASRRRLEAGPTPARGREQRGRDPWGDSYPAGSSLLEPPVLSGCSRRAGSPKKSDPAHLAASRVSLGRGYLDALIKWPLGYLGVELLEKNSTWPKFEPNLGRRLEPAGSCTLIGPGGEELKPRRPGAPGGSLSSGGRFRSL